MELVFYEDKTKYDLWGKIILAFAPALLIVLGLLTYCGVLPTETEEEARGSLIILFASAAFVLVLLWLILPRKYQILEEKLRIVLGGPFSFHIPFQTIEAAKHLSGAKAATFWGLNFSPVLKNVVGIKRKKGMNVTISPSNPGLFLENLDKALTDWKGIRGA
jgi:hypothetical protein